MAGFPDPNNHEPGVLSCETFDTWDAAFAYIKQRGISLDTAQEEEIKQYEDTQLSRVEFVNFGHSACTVNVQYDVRVIDANGIETEIKELLG
jgi:hypothetical protein